MKSKTFRVVVSGSFRRYFDEISKTVKAFDEIGIDVLSPRVSKIINPGEEFVILETDDTHDPKALEQRHLDAIAEADALYLCNPNGYIGDSSKMELGYAIALGKSVFCQEPLEDFTLKFFCDPVAGPEEVKNILAHQSPLQSINKRFSLGDFQRYVHEMVVRRGFDKETPKDVLLLLTEEIGELAKSMRKHLGLKSDQKRKEHYPTLEGELADVFIYILDLANLLDVSLFHAFYQKEEENEKRSWK